MASNRDNGNDSATIDQLRLGAGFAASEREDVIKRLRKLDRRLKRFDAQDVDLEVSVKERDSADQQVVLEARVAGYDTFVAKSRESVIKKALTVTRDEIWRQIDDAVNKRTVGRRRP